MRHPRARVVPDNASTVWVTRPESQRQDARVCVRRHAVRLRPDGERRELQTERTFGMVAVHLCEAAGVNKLNRLPERHRVAPPNGAPVQEIKAL